VSTREVAGLAGKRIGAQVVHQPVRVVDEELCRAGFESTLDGGIDLRLEQPAVVVLLDPRTAALIPVDDACGALHVGGDEDLHAAP
jgi:hypothetical protein